MRKNDCSTDMDTSCMSEIIRKHLMCTYPALAEHIQKCDVIEEKKPSDDKVLTILIQTVIGQMLSRKAAETIFNRVESRIQVVGQLGFLKKKILLRAVYRKGKPNQSYY
ncbi:hypothetical protein Q8W17_01490 [Photobacterium damselae subsp. piscicida]|nr:hypothetical protein [Photobacterium damselae subsp. piscicida]